MKLIRRGTFVFAIAAIAVLAFGQPAMASTHANTAPIAIPDGPAIPYPSDITVAGIQGTTMDVNVTLSGLSHTFPADVHALLVGPAGQTTLLMANAGSGFGVTGVNLTLDDSAANPLPAPLVTGTYKPGNRNTGCNVAPAFPAPAPAGPYGSALSAYNGGSANGTWKLFVTDTCFFDTGTFAGGWSLNIRACILPEIVAITDPTPAGPVVSALLCT